MMHQSTRRLLDRLSEMTRQKKIGWAENDYGIHYTTEGYTVHLVREPQTMQLLDGQGRVLEDVTADAIAQTHSEAGEAYSQIFDELFREGARQARGTESAIDAVLAGLDGDAAEPEPVLASLQPTEPTSDTTQYEDAVEETAAATETQSDWNTGAAVAGTAATAATATNMFQSDWSADTSGTSEQVAEPVTDSVAQPAHEWGQQDTYAAAEPVAAETETDVGQAVAAMADEINTQPAQDSAFTETAEPVVSATPEPTPVEPTPDQSWAQPAAEPEPVAAPSWDEPVAAAGDPEPAPTQDVWGQQTAVDQAPTPADPAAYPAAASDQTAAWQQPAAEQAPPEPLPQAWDTPAPSPDIPAPQVEVAPTEPLVDQGVSYPAETTEPVETAPQAPIHPGYEEPAPEPVPAYETHEPSAATQEASTWGAVGAAAETVTETADATFQGVEDGASALVQGVEDTVSDATAAVSGAVHDTQDAVGTAWTETTEYAAETTVDVVETVTEFGQDVANTVESVTPNPQDAISAVSGAIGGAASTVASAVTPDEPVSHEPAASAQPATPEPHPQPVAEDKPVPKKPMTRFNPWN